MHNILPHVDEAVNKNMKQESGSDGSNASLEAELDSSINTKVN